MRLGVQMRKEIVYNIDMASNGRSAARNVIVCVSLAHASERDFLSGVFRFLDDGHNWKVRIVQDHPPFSDESLRELERGGKADGIIISDAYRGDLIPALVDTPIPLAVVSGVAFQKTHPLAARRRPTFVVHNDNTSVGRLGFRHFCSCGKFNSYGFVPTERGVTWSDEREEAFVRAVRAAGFRAKAFRKSPGELGAWLADLPKPAAIMVAYDELASDVLAACEQEGLAVPRQVAVLGVDNDPLVCRSATPPLSSVLPDHEGMGYLAAKGLDDLMSGKSRRSTPKHVTLAPHKVVQRESTGTVIPAATLVDRAKAIIKTEAVKGITVEALAQRLHVSRRLAELRFREIEGTTISKAIAARKLDAALHLVKTTRYPLARIAEECGFSDAKHLTHRFTARFGRPPRDFRSR